MAIEIKELQIRLNVESKSKTSTDIKPKITNEDKAHIVKECVKRVLEKLDNKFER